MANTLQQIALLWDIDGTLLDTKGVAAKQLVQSFQEVTRKGCSINPGQYSGFTDYEIVLDLLFNAGLQSDINRAEEILTHYGTRLMHKLIQNPPTLLADIQSVFQKLERFAYVKHFIGSGNSKLGAHAKIHSSGLQKYFAEKSFFISTPEKVSRDSVIQSAANTIASPTLLIGDSDRDILSAKKNSLKVLAVATGHHQVNQLRRLNPDFLLGQSWNAKDFLNVIYSFSQNCRP